MVSENTNLKTSFLIDVIFSLALGVHSKSSANFKFTLPAGGATSARPAGMAAQRPFQSTLPAGGATAKVHVFYARIYPYTINSARRFS